MIEEITTSDSPPEDVMSITTADLQRWQNWGRVRLFAGMHRWFQAPEARQPEGLTADGSTIAKEPTNWLPRALERLHDLLELPHNWDGCGSPPPSDSIVSSAESVLSRLSRVVPSNLPSTFVCPVSGGGVGLEWTSQAKHLEIEFVSETEVVWLTEDMSRPGPSDAMDAGEIDLSKGVGLLQQKLLWFAS